MKQSEWNSYWDKKINEHFNVKPAERIVLREFVENVFNEKYGIEEASKLAVGQLVKNPVRIKNFIDKIEAGNLFTLSDPSSVGKLDIDAEDGNIDAADKGKVLIDPKNEQTKRALQRMKDYLSMVIGDDRSKQRVTKKYESELGQKFDATKILSKIKLGTDYYAATEDGIADESQQVEIPLGALAKTEEFGGKGSAGPNGADWELLISWAVNESDAVFGDPTDKKDAASISKFKGLVSAEAGFYATQSKKLARNIRNQYPALAKQEFGSLGKAQATASDTWKDAFATEGIGEKVKGSTLTSKTDVKAGDYKMSFKKAGGAQLMSAGRGEALATIVAVSKHYKYGGKETAETIERIKSAIVNDFNAKLTDPDNPGRKLTIEQIKKQMDSMSDEQKIAAAERAANGDPDLIGQFINDDAMHKQVSKDLQSILNTEVKKVAKGAAEGLKGDKFGTLLCLEAMTGNIKFASEPHKANHLFCFDPNNSQVLLKKITTAEAAKVASEAKFYVSYKTSGNPYSSLKVGHTTKLDEYSKALMKKEMKLIGESLSKDREFLNEMQWFIENEGMRILQENNLFDRSKQLLAKGMDKVSDLTAKAVSVGKTAVERAKAFWGKIVAIASKAWGAIVEAVSKAFSLAMDTAREIASQAGAVAGFSAIGLELDAGGDSDGMESNPDIASIFM
jgi:hypothetical protein